MISVTEQAMALAALRRAVNDGRVRITKSEPPQRRPGFVSKAKVIPYVLYRRWYEGRIQRMHAQGLTWHGTPLKPKRTPGTHALYMRQWRFKRKEKGLPI
jgi:hypothetical protein